MSKGKISEQKGDAEKVRTEKANKKTFSFSMTEVPNKIEKNLTDFSEKK